MANWHREMVQTHQRLRIHCPMAAARTCFVHISAVGTVGLDRAADNQKVKFDIDRAATVVSLPLNTRWQFKR